MVISIGSKYCWGGGNNGDGRVFSNQNACLAAMGGGTTGSSDLTQIPQTSIDTPGELIGLIDTIGTWIFSALLAIVVIFLVVAGFMFVTAGGNAEQVIKARQMLINALIGLAVALGARGLQAIITKLLA